MYNVYLLLRSIMYPHFDIKTKRYVIPQYRHSIPGYKCWKASIQRTMILNLKNGNKKSWIKG